MDAPSRTEALHPKTRKLMEAKAKKMPKSKYIKIINTRSHISYLLSILRWMMADSVNWMLLKAPLSCSHLQVRISLDDFVENYEHHLSSFMLTLTPDSVGLHIGIPWYKTIWLICVAIFQTKNTDDILALQIPKMPMNIQSQKKRKLSGQQDICCLNFPDKERKSRQFSNLRQMRIKSGFARFCT